MNINYNYVNDITFNRPTMKKYIYQDAQASLSSVKLPTAELISDKIRPTGVIGRSSKLRSVIYIFLVLAPLLAKISLWSTSSCIIHVIVNNFQCH